MIENVNVTTKANIFFDGKCVSHTMEASDGRRMSVGVIFPSSLHFNTGAPEVMEITAGHCRVKLEGEAAWTNYEAGQRFAIGPNSGFDIETRDVLEYVCHFG